MKKTAKTPKKLLLPSYQGLADVNDSRPPRVGSADKGSLLRQRHRATNHPSRLAFREKTITLKAISIGCP